MAVSLNNADIITELGDHHLVAVDGGEIKRIKAADLGIGGGGGGGDSFNPYAIGAVYPLPGTLITGTASAAAANDGTIRAYSVARTDALNLGLHVRKAAVGETRMRIGLYKAPAAATSPSGATLVTDFGEVVITTAEEAFTTSALPSMSDADSRYFVVVFHGISSGTLRCTTTATQVPSGGLPVDFSAVATNLQLRYDGTLTYPAACPAVLPTTTTVTGTTTLVPVMVQRLS